MTSRGFSLIEVVVALTLSSAIMAGGLFMFKKTRYVAVEATVRAELARDAQLALDVVGRDFATLGAGVPAGKCNDASCTPGASLHPAVRRAGALYMAFLGDAAYPNAELSGAVSIARFAGDADSARVAVSSELNGACLPYATTAATAFRCRTTATSLVPLDTSSTTDDCFQGQSDGRTCPWSLGKWQRGRAGARRPALVAVDARRKFYARRWSGATAAVDNAFGVELAAGAAGTAPLPRSEFFVSVGGGHLVALDRVLYSVENAAMGGGACSSSDCVLKRRQCWGLIEDPTAATFPAAGTGQLLSTTTPAACTAPDDGTGWETVLTNIESFSLAYTLVGSSTTVSEVATADLPKVRAVDVTFTTKRDPPGGGRTLRQRVAQRFFLGNRSEL
jgi:prepilin-type N-terminal cleavage/methylation domain-containing protein